MTAAAVEALHSDRSLFDAPPTAADGELVGHLDLGASWSWLRMQTLSVDGSVRNLVER